MTLLDLQGLKVIHLLQAFSNAISDLSYTCVVVYKTSTDREHRVSPFHNQHRGIRLNVYHCIAVMLHQIKPHELKITRALQ